jgi:hypothetical protein
LGFRRLPLILKQWRRARPIAGLGEGEDNMVVGHRYPVSVMVKRL